MNAHRTLNSELRQSLTTVYLLSAIDRHIVILVPVTVTVNLAIVIVESYAVRN